MTTSSSQRTRRSGETFKCSIQKRGSKLSSSGSAVMKLADETTETGLVCLRLLSILNSSSFISALSADTNIIFSVCWVSSLPTLLYLVGRGHKIVIWTIGSGVSPRRPTEKPFVMPELRRLPHLFLGFKDEITPLLSVFQRGGGGG